MPGQKWTNEEIEFVKAKFDLMSTEDIAVAINKSQKAVQNRIKLLNLTKYQPKIGDVLHNRKALDVSIQNNGRQNKTMIKVLCACDREKYITITDFKLGKFQNCNYCKDMKGDIKARVANRNKDDYKRIYRIYKAIHTRCYNPKAQGYQYYGGKGVKMCQLWIDDFNEFYNWSLANNYSIEYTVDRINVQADYSPENCRWVDKYTQANNKSDNVHLTIFNETKTMAEWSRDDRCLVTYNILASRIKKGIEPLLAMTKPKRKNKYLTHELYLFIKNNHPEILEEFWKIKKI